MPSNPNPVLIYLAGPIDGINNGDATEWRRSVAVAWPDVAFFNPVGAYYNDNKSTIPVIDFFNKYVLQHCFGVLANLKGPGRGFGTIREIEIARQASRPVVVVGDMEDSLMTYDLTVCSSFEEGMNELMTKVADILNQPPTVFGIPLMMREATEEDEDQ